MDWYKIETSACNTINFVQKSFLSSSSESKCGYKEEKRPLGGIIRNGTMAWLADKCSLRVVSLRKGETLATHTFHYSLFNCTSILSVEEVVAANNAQNVLLAVCLDTENDLGVDMHSSLIAIYSVAHGSVLSCFHIPLYVTSMCFMSLDNCRRSLLQSFDGCLSVGTQKGDVFVIDLYLNELLKLHEDHQKELITSNLNITECRIVEFNLPPTEIRRIYQKCLQDRNLEEIVHFGIRIEVVDSSCAVESLLPISLLTGLAAGLEDGRLIIYDLMELQIIYASKPDSHQKPLVKMNFLEPPDDPRACLYILTLHENGSDFSGMLHEIMYEKRVTDNFCSYYENFLRGGKKLQLQLENSISSVISCQSISKLPTNSDEDATSLFIISWHSILEEKNKVLVLDMNQWYKEEMPAKVHLQRAICYLAGYQLKEGQCGLESFINPTTLANFNSLQRCEEHFYPNSLSFDCLLLFSTGCFNYKWPGIQNKVINNLREKNATLFLEPEQFFEEIRSARLLPQFTELNADATFSKTAIYEVILAVALEHNCIGLLLDCVRSWADGSFTCNMGWASAGAELSLQFLKKWIWKRASLIKERSNELCQGLLHKSGYPLDQRSKKELGALTRQLNTLADLMDEVSKQHVKFNILENGTVPMPKNESLRLAADYQDLLLWLINIGVLPENMRHVDISADIASTSRRVSPAASIYPYKRLSHFYTQKRATYAKIDENYIVKKSGSCRLIFIDAFIEHECMQRARSDSAGRESSNTLREYWQENGGNGLYPPATIESMLRIMLLSNVSYESKCSVLLYFFLDLHVALNDEEQTEIKAIVANLLKFPSVFRLSPSFVKSIQGFWHLDHGHFLTAVEEFLSPFNNNENHAQWLIELQVESLLIQNAPHLAVRILDAHPDLISPMLKLSILLSNNLIAEAFHFSRSKDNDDLMKRFFISCLKMGKLGVIRDLALNEREGQIVEKLLRESELPGAESLHFVYLLQKSKYIEAVSYMNELSTGKCGRTEKNYICNSIDAPDLVNSAMNTMAPVTQSLTSVYFRIQNKIKQRETNNRSPLPLSCQLTKQNANNLIGGIYHSSALGAHFASCYFDEQFSSNRTGRNGNFNPMSARNAPFLRKPQTETHSEVIDQLQRQTLSYPQEYRANEKRKHEETQQQQKHQQQQLQTPCKRRRLVAGELMADLKQIQEKNIILNESGFELSTQNTKEFNQSFLTKPLTEQVDKRNAPEKEALQAPQKVVSGILKLGTPEPTELRKIKRGVSPAVEEKTLRFALPPSSLITSETFDKAGLTKTEESVASIQNKTITGTLSDESNASDDAEDATANKNAPQGKEATEYFSTLSDTQKLNRSSILLRSATAKDSGISVTTKDAALQSSVGSFYSTARAKSNSPCVLGPQARKPLKRASADPEVSLRHKMLTAHVHGVEKHMDSNSPGQVSSTGFKINSVVTLTSTEFTPKICSSKISESHSKFMSEQIKISERSTIVMGSGTSSCDFEAMSMLSSKVGFPRPTARFPLAVFKEDKENVVEPHLDTTLGMSSCDITPLEMTREEEKLATSMEIEEEDAEEVHESGITDTLPFLTACSQLIPQPALSESQVEISESVVIEEVVESEEKSIPLQSSSESNVQISESVVIEEVFDSQDESTRPHSLYKSEAKILESITIEEVVESEDEVIEVISSESNDDENISLNSDGDDGDDGDDNDDCCEDAESDSDAEIVQDESYDVDYENNDSNDSNTTTECTESTESSRDNQTSNQSLNSESNNQKKSHRSDDFYLFLDDDSNDVNKPEKSIDEVGELEQKEESIVENNAEIADIYENMEVEESTILSDVVAIEPKSQDQLEMVQSDEILRPAMEDIEEFISPQNEKRPMESEVIAQPKTEDATLQLEESSQEPAELNTENKEDITSKDFTSLSEELGAPDNEAHLSGTFAIQSEDVEALTEVSSVSLSQNEKSVVNEDLSPSDSRLNSKEEFTNEDHLSQSIQEKDESKDELDLIDGPSTTATSDAELSAPQQESEKINQSPLVGSESELIEEDEKNKNNEEQQEVQETIVEFDVRAENIDSTENIEEPEDKEDEKVESTLESVVTQIASPTVGKMNQDNVMPKSAKNEEESRSPSESVSPSAFVSITAKQSTEEKVHSHNLRSFKTEDILKSSGNVLKLTPRTRNRGQSMPPESVSNVEEHIESEVHTPQRRSMRGISVPPQTVLSEETPFTPVSRNRSTNRRSLVAESGDSPISPNSSRSGRGSAQPKRHQSEISPVALLDSPALRTRSRLRNVSESSDATLASTPSTSVKQRRPSIANQKDVDTKRARRLMLKDEDEETTIKNVPTVESPLSFVDSRRLTRKQRALLEARQSVTAAYDDKDDQMSMSSQISQSSLQAKRRPPSRVASSVKSHDDGDDDGVSIASSAASELRRSTRRIRLQQQQQHASNPNLTSIPEQDDDEEAPKLRQKRTKTTKK